MMIHDVNTGIHKRKKRKRIGRGPGSGHGKTSGRGHKGQGQLAGWSQSPIFQGGTQPLIRRIGIRGFNNRFAKDVYAINISQIAESFGDGDEITPEILRERGIVKHPYDHLKILGDGELTKKLKVTAHRFSKSAEEKIKAAGGEVVVLPGPKPVVKNKMKPRKPKAKA
jgi:large subunit ribosomal protein L15